MRTVGWLIVVAGIFFTHLETVLSGGNWIAQSAPEAIADTCGVAMVGIGLVIVYRGRKQG
jgi:hypothetical protein